MLSRREFLMHSGAVVLASGLPRVALAGAETESRLVLVILRGAMDGLGAVPAYGDGQYRGVRGTLALDGPGAAGGVLKLDGLFGLHPSLQSLHRLHAEEQLVVCHAVATTYRERSHFDAQNLLENGTGRPGGTPNGDQVDIPPRRKRGPKFMASETARPQMRKC